MQSTKIFVQQLTKDGMIVMIAIAPLLIGSIFKWGVPYLETELVNYFDETSILQDYFIIFDLLLAILTPYLLCFAAAMTMLDEYDSNVINHLCVTPLGKRGYLFSRLVLPLLFSFIISIIVVTFFSITSWQLLTTIAVVLLTSLLSLTVTLIVFSYSNNKIEGLALAKLSGLVMIGIIIPFVIIDNVQYYFSILPSFWIAKFLIESNLIYFFIALSMTTIWIFIIYKKFIKKLTS